MAHFVRLIVCVLLWSVSAFAHAYPATPSNPNACLSNCFNYGGLTGSNGGTPPLFPTPIQAAQWYVGKTLNGGNGTCTFAAITSVSASGTGTAARYVLTCAAGSNSPQPFNVQARAPDTVTYSCPSGGTLAGASCTCPAGQTDTGTACETPNPCANHQQLWSSYNGSVQMVKGATSVCSGGCQVSFKAGYEGADLYGAGDDGVLRGWVPVGQLQSTQTEGTCATPSEPAAQPVPDAERPPIGTCPGEFNGMTVYKPCSRTETVAVKASTETDGSGNSTQKSESRSTTCTAAGSCSTTVTTTTTVNGGSATTTTNTTTQGKGEFCAENPGAKECGDGDGSSFGGSCDAGFQCEGDAVQCALAKEVYTQNCKLNKVTDESTLYGAEKDLQGSQTEDLPGNETIPFGASSYDDSDAIGGAACVSDLSVEVFAQSITLPLSGICPYLVWVRNALLALGSLAWLLIVFRR